MKNQNLIEIMTYEEKINLLICDEKYKTKSISTFNFPLLNFCDLFDNINYKNICIPSKKSIASSFDNEKLKEIIINLIELNKKEKKNLIPTFSLDLIKENLSEDYLLNTKFIKECLDIISSLPYYSLLTLPNNIDLPLNHDSFLDNMYKELITNSKPYFLLVRNYNELNYFKNELHFKGLFLGETDDPYEAIKLLNNGCIFIFSNKKENIIQSLISSKEKYQNLLLDKSNSNPSIDLIDEDQFINIDVLSSSLDKLISIYLNIKNDNITTPLNKIISSLDNNFLNISLESYVLIKNDDILPLKKDNTLLIGNFDTHSFKCRRYSSNINYSLVEDHLNKYQGLHKINQIIRFDDIGSLDKEFYLDLDKIYINFDQVIIYIDLFDEENLPKEYISLIKYFKDKDIKIILSLISDNFIKIDESLCDGYLFTYNSGSHVNDALIKILLGKISPVGKIILEEKLNSSTPLYINLANKSYFLKGLSYAKFEYSKFEINNNEIKFVVKNLSDYDTSLFISLFVENPLSNTFYKNKILRDYQNIEIKGNDSKSISFNFSDLTFLYYDEEKDCYGVEGGKYNLFINTSYVDNIKIFEMEISSYLENKNEYVEEDISKNNEEEFIDQKNQKIKSLKSKRNVFIILMISLILCNSLLLISQIILNNFILIFIFGGIEFLLLSLFILFLILKSLKIKKISKTPNVTLSSLVNQMPVYNEMNKIVYNKPIDLNKVEVSETISQEEVIEENIEENIENKEILSDQFDLSLRKENKKVLYPFSSFDELVNVFIKYLEQNDLMISYKSAKSFLASLQSNKMIIVNCLNKEYEDKFISLIIDFFYSQTQCVNLNLDKYDYHSYLLDKDKNSSFLNDILLARNSKTLSLMPLKVNDINLFSNVFSMLILDSKFKNEINNIKLNDEIDLKLEQSLRYIIFPQQKNYLDNLNDKLINASLNVVIELRYQKFEGNKDEEKIISYNLLNDFVSKTNNQFYLKESSFKKLDELEENYINKGYSLNNIDILQIENYSSLLLSTSLSENEVLDLILLGKIIPKIKNTSLYKNENGERIFIESLEKIFDEESLTLSLPYLNKIIVEKENLKNENLLKEEIISQENNINLEENISIKEESSNEEINNQSLDNEENKEEM